MKGGAGSVVVVFLVGLVSVVLVGGEGGNLKEECSNVIEKVVVCLDFATGKVSAPSTDCCDSIKDMRDTKPGCLCLIIQQTHSGSPQIKSFGIQEPKLLQLPSICALKNSNISDCPRLLGLPANSPDATIFTNFSSAAVPKSAGSPAAPSGSFGTKTVPHFVSGLSAVTIAVFLIGFRPAAIAFFS